MLTKSESNLQQIHWIFKVRVINPRDATAARVRVIIESSNRTDHWGTIGVSENIIDASWMALVDSIDALVETAALFDLAPLPRGDRVVMMTDGPAATVAKEADGFRKMASR